MIFPKTNLIILTVNYCHLSLTIVFTTKFGHIIPDSYVNYLETHLQFTLLIIRHKNLSYLDS